MSTQQPESLQLAHVCDHPIPPDWSDMVAAVRELLQLHAENEALQQVYDARQLEIDHLRGATKMMEPAQPVAWLVYLPSIDTQNVYASQEDMGYVDDVTNHADAEVTPLYEMAAPKAEVAPAGEYPPLPTGSAWCGDDDVRDFGAGAGESALMFEPTQTQHVPLFTAGQMRAYVDADRAMRAQADSQPVPTRAFLERTLAAMESVIDVADRQTDEFEALRSCIIDLSVLLFSKSAPARDYPPLPMQFACSGVFPVYSADQMHAYVDADRAMRAQAAPAAAAGPSDLVTRESAMQAIEHVAIHNSSYREREAVEMLAAAPATQAAPAAQEDAARWRWLRENWFTMTSSYDQQRIRFKVGEPRWSDIAETELDAAIDAARSQAKEGDTQ